MPTVSVVIATHNRPELLKKALDSVYAQTFTNYEVIVVDDGDSPQAQKVVEAFLGKGNIRYIETKKNTGGAATRNVGIRNAVGRFIAFLDDDDAWVPKKLEKQIPLFAEDEKIGFVFSAVNNVYEDHVHVTTVDPLIRDYRTISLIRFNGFLTSGLVVRKDVFDVVGLFDETLPSHQEADLVLRIAQVYNGAGVNEALVNMCFSNNGDHIGGNVDRRIKGREMVLEKHAPLIKSHPDLLSRHYFWLALQYRMKGDFYQYTKHCMDSVRLRMRINVLGHLCYGFARMLFSNAKQFLLKTVFRPAHYGLLLRLMYFRKYVPHEVVTRNSTRVLDAGCGRGRFTEVVARQNPTAHITSVDIQPQKEWEEYDFPNVSFKTQDLHTLGAEDEYNLIMSVDVLEHILDNHLIILRFHKALKQGGFLFLMVPCDATTFHFFPKRWFREFYEWEAKEHIGMQYTKAEWCKILRDAGFTILCERYTFTFWGTLAWEIEYLLSRKSWGRKLSLFAMPLYRLFGFLDIYIPIGKGNNLIVAKKG